MGSGERDALVGEVEVCAAFAVSLDVAEVADVPAAASSELHSSVEGGNSLSQIIDRLRQLVQDDC